MQDDAPLPGRSTAKMLAQIEDREKSKGIDEFGQPYVAVGPTLASLVQMRNDLGWAAVLQGDVNRKTSRLLDTRPASCRAIRCSMRSPLSR